MDLGAVTHMDARGIGTLAVLIAQAKSAERRLVLARASDRVERVLRLTQLDVTLRDEFVPDRSALPAEAEEDGELLEEAVARSHLGPRESRNGREGART